jgi:hypothetical protein
MEPLKEVFEMIIGLVAVGGGLGIGIYAIYIDTTTKNREKLAAAEALHKERMALIEKGMDPLIADKKIEKGLSPNVLLWALLLIGIALGALIGYAVAVRIAAKETILVNAMALLFGGFGLLVYYINRRRTDLKKPL